MQLYERSLNCGCKNRNLKSKSHMILRLIALYILLAASFLAHSSQKLVEQADSLFASQKYTEAFDIYEGPIQYGKSELSYAFKDGFY